MIRSLACLLLAAATTVGAQEIRLGIIGTDSTHALEFTRLLNDPHVAGHVSGARVVVAYRGGNAHLPLSRDRIDRISTALAQQLSIPFVSTIGELCPKVDGILLLSVDPTSRLKEFTQAAACHKPVFIDKPLAGSLAVARRLAQFAAKSQTPWFTASALRYSAPAHPGTLLSVDVWGPGDLGKAGEGYTLDLAWYGIHSMEAMYGWMGPGVTHVSRIHRPDSDTLTCQWQDGRSATVHLYRPDYAFGALLFPAGKDSPQRVDLSANYSVLLEHIVLFMQTGKSPVSPREAMEVFRLMQAAQQSLQHHGALTPLTKP